VQRDDDAISKLSLHDDNTMTTLSLQYYHCTLTTQPQHYNNTFTTLALRHHCAQLHHCYPQYHHFTVDDGNERAQGSPARNTIMTITITTLALRHHCAITAQPLPSLASPHSRLWTLALHLHYTITVLSLRNHYRRRWRRARSRICSASARSQHRYYKS
jgi:hypothetical protein